MAVRLDDSEAFLSRFGGGRLSSAQFLAEGMCARKARKDRVTLPDHFWACSKEWADEFLCQAVHANRLLKDYSAEAVIGALKATEGRQIYSLGRPAILPLVRIEQDRLHRRKAVANAEMKPQPAAPAERPRPHFTTKKSLLEMLRDLD